MRSSRSGPDPLDPGHRGFAHRGLHGPGIPENTLAAFAAAIAFGAGIECDVRLSVDGEAMVVHDSDLRRIAASGLIVEKTSARVLGRQCLLGTRQHIPRLSELLQLVAGRVPLLVELKCRRGNAALLAQAAMREIDRYAGPVGVMSFESCAIQWLRRHRPMQRRGLVVSARGGRLWRWRAMRRAAPDFFAVDRLLLGSPWASKLRSRNIVYSWTIRTAAQRETAAVHADSLIWEADGRP